MVDKIDLHIAGLNSISKSVEKSIIPLFECLPDGKGRVSMSAIYGTGIFLSLLVSILLFQQLMFWRRK